MSRVDTVFAVLGALLVLLGVWLIADGRDGGGALTVGGLWLAFAGVKSLPLAAPAARLLARFPKRLKAVLGSVFYALAAFGVLLPPEEFTPAWTAAMALVVAPLVLQALVRLWRGPAPATTIQQLDDALIIDPPGRLYSAISCFWSLSLCAGFALATYLFIRGPRLEWDDWAMLFIAPAFALGNALRAFVKFVPAVVPPPRLRLDTAGIHAGRVSIPWSEVVGAKLNAAEILVERRAPASIIGDRPNRVRLTIPADLTDNDERTIRAFLERHVPA